MWRRRRMIFKSYHHMIRIILLCVHKIYVRRRTHHSTKIKLTNFFWKFIKVSCIIIIIYCVQVYNNTNIFYILKAYPPAPNVLGDHDYSTTRQTFHSVAQLCRYHAKGNTQKGKCKRERKRERKRTVTTTFLTHLACPIAPHQIPH